MNRYWNNTDGNEYSDGAGNTVSGSDTTYWLRVTRNGSTIYRQYSTDGTTYNTISSYLKSDSIVSVSLYTDRTGSGSFDSFVDDLILTDGYNGAGSVVNIDPSGKSCT